MPQNVTLTDDEEEKMQERLKDIDLQVKALTKNHGQNKTGHTPYTIQNRPYPKKMVEERVWILSLTVYLLFASMVY
jgi:hypothetical protein